MSFAELYFNLDQTNQTNKKVDLIAEFFKTASDEDKIWALALFTGRRPKKTVSTSLLREWAAEASGYPEWLFEESYQIVGDLAETIALMVPSARTSSNTSLSQWMAIIQQMSHLEQDEKKETIQQIWQGLMQSEILVFNKLLTGGFRVGVSSTLFIKGLSKATGIEANKLTHRIMGAWQPGVTTFAQLIHGENVNDNLSQPYPFYLAYPLENTDDLGLTTEWIAEWKWDGIRSQIIKREGELFIWSRGEELITDKFPELLSLKESLPDGTVIDGELMCHTGEHPLPFHLLQTRVSRKNVSKKQLSEAPALVMAYDLLEWQGEDIRELPLHKRRLLLEECVELSKNEKLKTSPLVPFNSWQALSDIQAEAEKILAEGFMLKHLNSTYKVGRKKGDWWKWKIDPKTIDGVLIYAQKGHGRRADLYTDYTFGVWHDGKLVSFAKAYSGLTDAEIKQVDAFIKKNTIEKFGPVRTVKPELVFEISFEGINASPRHKSGVALRFPRISRWRKDKKPEEADHLETLKKLLPS
jgi:DNA ligase-1